MLKFLSGIEKATDEFFTKGIWEYLISSAIIVFSVLIILKILNKVFYQMKERRHDTALQLSFLWNVIKVIGILIIIVGVTYQIEPLHNISVSLLASSGLIAIFIGAASQDAVSNIVGGVFIAVFKPFLVGDRIKIYDNNIVGIIEDITTRHTVIRTFENSRIIVPNKIMNSAVLENYHYTEKSVCNFLDISISYESNIDNAIQIIKKLAENHKNCVDNRNKEAKEAGEPIVSVRVTALGEYSVNLRASIWSYDPGKGYTMLCDLRKSIKDEFDKNNIKFPLPVRDVRIQNY